jgi:hypothetical protein
MPQVIYLAVDLLFVLLAILAFPRTQKHTPSSLSLSYAMMSIDSPTQTSIPMITVSEANSPEDDHPSEQAGMRVRIDAPKDRKESEKKKFKTTLRPATPYVKGDFPTDDLDSEDDEQDL